ncbi:hypothetical protein ACKA01_02895 [Helcococcus kunzii]|uniref:helix-turn-helix domain-containing protein n=1 Tax=Helcococcus kunzii TaxID=40091 RepID=UPI001BAE7EC3|nr:Rgg/GadR/MutR family transcriptional regulator [Helcococcus kunzii]QUY65235.1 hypothetical protein GUI37_06740 [Helcococcus kunzii]
MENLGKTFKELRISRKLTLQEIANDEFSISMLSKFENGKTEISVNKLNMALSNLHMSINEFYYLANDLEYDKFREIYFKSIRLKNRKDLKGLMKLYNEQIALSKTSKLSKFKLLDSIIIASAIKELDESFELTEEQRALMHDYLFTIEIWGEYEMILFTRSIEFFKAKVYLNYAREMLKKIDYFKDMSAINNMLQTAIIQGLFLSIDQDYEFGASYFNKKAYEYIYDTRDAYMKIIYMFANGYYKIYKGEIENGKQSIEKSLEILQTLGYTEQYQYYKTSYENILKTFRSENK